MLPFEQMPVETLTAARAVLTDIDDTQTTDGCLTARAYGALERVAATGVPVIRLYKPKTGLTPARTAEAMPSGMAAMAAVRPASVSRPIVLRLIFRLVPIVSYCLPVVYCLTAFMRPVLSDSDYFLNTVRRPD